MTSACYAGVQVKEASILSCVHTSTKIIHPDHVQAQIFPPLDGDYLFSSVGKGSKVHQHLIGGISHIYSPSYSG
ncbi:unnamed protein product [Urochloa humidicola]